MCDFDVPSPSWSTHTSRKTKPIPYVLFAQLPISVVQDSPFSPFGMMQLSISIDVFNFCMAKPRKVRVFFNPCLAKPSKFTAFHILAWQHPPTFGVGQFSALQETNHSISVFFRSPFFWTRFDLMPQTFLVPGHFKFWLDRRPSGSADSTWGCTT